MTPLSGRWRGRKSGGIVRRSVGAVNRRIRRSVATPIGVPLHRPGQLELRLHDVRDDVVRLPVLSPGPCSARVSHRPFSRRLKIPRASGPSGFDSQPRHHAFGDPCEGGVGLLKPGRLILDLVDRQNRTVSRGVRPISARRREMGTAPVPTSSGSIRPWGEPHDGRFFERCHRPPSGEAAG